MKSKTEIVVYPDNSLCIDGRLKGADPELMAQLGIQSVRHHDQKYNTPDAKIVTFGQCQGWRQYPLQTMPTEAS